MIARNELRFPPGPRARYPGELFVTISRDTLGLLSRVAREHGDVAGFRLGPQRMVLLSHPDDIRDLLVTNQRNFHKGRGLERAKLLLGEGLLTSEGDFHLRQRRLAQPAFHRQRIAAYGDTMGQYAARVCDRWRDGQTIDVHDEMMRLTLAVVAKTLFDADIERAEAAEVGAALTQTFRSFGFAILPFTEMLDRLHFLPPVRRFRDARARLDAVIYRMIAEHRADPRDRGDLLSMLLLAQDTEAEASASGAARGMTDEQMRDECMTIFLAGHETVSNALTWTFYLLSNAPEVRARVEEEATALAGRVPGADDMPQLSYTRAVIAEAMRLYPPAWVVGRRALGACEMGGFSIPARSVVLTSQFLVHRDPRWWPDPERFDPDRWVPGTAQHAAGENRPKFAYFPFGGGTRVCIGEQFAWMEAVLLLTTIVQRWRLSLEPGHPVAIEAIITLRPKHGMVMRATRRD